MHSLCWAKRGAYCPDYPCQSVASIFRHAVFPSADMFQIGSEDRLIGEIRRGRSNTKNTDAGVPLLRVTSGWLRRTQAPSQGDRVRRVRHLCVSSIFICRPSNNTAASPKDQGRCLLHFSFLKGACGLSSFQGSFELKLCIKELTVLPGERSFKKSLLKQQEVGAARQISFVNSAQ